MLISFDIDFFTQRDKPEIPIPNVDSKRGCGYKNSNGVGFKITGAVNQEAEFGEFPWMVAILREESQLNLYECGGALITPDVILTAAHCVYNKDPKTLIGRLKAIMICNLYHNTSFIYQSGQVNGIRKRRMK